MNYSSTKDGTWEWLNQKKELYFTQLNIVYGDHINKVSDIYEDQLKFDLSENIIEKLRTFTVTRLTNKELKLVIDYKATLNNQEIKIIRGFMMKNNGIYHEKGVDVRIAVDMVVGAYENEFDTVILISSDTDLIPAVENVVKKKKKIEYIGLTYRPSFGLMKKVTETKLLTKKELEKFQ